MGNWTNAITLFFSLFMALWPSSCWVPSPLSAAPNDTSQQFTTDMFSHCKLMLNSEAESRGRSLGDFTFCSCVSAVTSRSSFGSILRYVFYSSCFESTLCVGFFFAYFIYLFFAWLICPTCQIWAGSKETSRLNFTATNGFHSPLYLAHIRLPPRPPFVPRSCIALPHFQANPFIIFHEDNKTTLFFFFPPCYNASPICTGE